MAHSWWRDSDYELFDRLTRERDEARGSLAICLDRAQLTEPSLHEANARARDFLARAEKAEEALRECVAVLEQVDNIACRTVSGGHPEDLPEPCPVDGEELVNVVRPALDAARKVVG